MVHVMNELAKARKQLKGKNVGRMSVHHLKTFKTSDVMCCWTVLAYKLQNIQDRKYSPDVDIHTR